MNLLHLTPSAKICHKHPEERVVGVCSACLAQKLTSLIYTNPPPPAIPTEQAGPRPQLLSSPPGSADSPVNQEHQLQTIKEEEGSDAEVISNEGVTYRCLEAPNSVQAVTKALCLHDDQVHLTLDHTEFTSSQADTSLNQKAPIVNPISDLQEERPATSSDHLHARKPANFKRSKSLSVLSAVETVKPAERSASHGGKLASILFKEKSDFRSVDADKVTLRNLFRLEDAEKQTDKESEFVLAETSEDASDHKLKEEVFHHGSLEDVKNTNEETVVDGAPDDDTHSSRCCIPSTSSLSSSVCPSVPDKINSLLCRKTRDDKRACSGKGLSNKLSQVHESKHRNFSADGCAYASDDSGLIRATYIASESRDPSMRRCRSRERYVTRTSFSSSEPVSPVCVSQLDSRSERKFNVAARALAIEVPSIFQASIGGQDDVLMDFLTKRLDSVYNAAQGSEILVYEDEDEAKCRNTNGCFSKTSPLDTVMRAASSNTEISSIEEKGEKHSAMQNKSIEGCRGLTERGAEYAEAGQGRGGEYVDAGEGGATEEEGESEDQRRGEEGATEHQRTGEKQHWRIEQGGETEERGIGHGLPEEYGRSASSIEEQGEKGQGHHHHHHHHQQQHVIWESYCKSGKSARPSGSSTCRWPSSSSRTVSRVAPDRPLLRFYLTPLRSSGRTRPRPPKRHLWSLVFA